MDLDLISGYGIWEGKGKRTWRAWRAWTHLPPLPHAVVLLEEPLVVRHAVFAVEEARFDRSGLRQLVSRVG